MAGDPQGSGPRRRIEQGLRALWPDRAAVSAADTLARRTLSPHLAAEFLKLPPFDRQHLAACRTRLQEQGVTDQDLLDAALLHDLGKVDGPYHVRLVDRALRVILRAASPKTLSTLSEPPAAGWQAGLVLATHHPWVGSVRARSFGASERTCWLILHHEDRDPQDPDLRLLQAADSAS